MDYWSSEGVIWGDVRNGRAIGLLKDLIDNRTDWIVGANYWTEPSSMVENFLPAALFFFKK